MSKRAAGWVRSWAVGLCGAAALCACSSDGGSNGAAGESADDGATNAQPSSEGQRNVSGADGIYYQVVETADGVSMEAITSNEVQSFSCPTATCGGICNECAARACEAVGELSDVCARLVRDCNAACSCGDAFSPGSCGFPVCSTNRNVCYMGGEPAGPFPRDPEPDPDPSPVSPGNSSTPNGGGAATPASSSSPNGSGAATPAPAG